MARNETKIAQDEFYQTIFGPQDVYVCNTASFWNALFLIWYLVLLSKSAGLPSVICLLQHVVASNKRPPPSLWKVMVLINTQAFSRIFTVLFTLFVQKIMNLTLWKTPIAVKTFCYKSLVMRKPDFAYAKTKAQINFAVIVKLISAFVFATRIVQFLFFLNPKFPFSSHPLKLHRPVCVRPGRKPRNPVLASRLIIFTILYM